MTLSELANPTKFLALTARALPWLVAVTAILEPLSFGAPFSILCALSLFSLVLGPFAAAASLRQGLD